MPDFNYQTLAERIASLKAKQVDLTRLVVHCRSVLSALDIEIKASGFSMPSDFLALHDKKHSFGMQQASGHLISYYRLLYMSGFLYSLLSYLNESDPLDLLNLEKARISSQRFDILNRDEKIVFLLIYRFRDFRATARWLRSDPNFTSLVQSLETEKNAILAEVDQYFGEIG